MLCGPDFLGVLVCSLRVRESPVPLRIKVSVQPYSCRSLPPIKRDMCRLPQFTVTHSHLFRDRAPTPLSGGGPLLLRAVRIQARGDGRVQRQQGAGPNPRRWRRARRRAGGRPTGLARPRKQRHRAALRRLCAARSLLRGAQAAAAVAAMHAGTSTIIVAAPGVFRRLPLHSQERCEPTAPRFLPGYEGVFWRCTRFLPCRWWH